MKISLYVGSRRVTASNEPSCPWYLRESLTVTLATAYSSVFR